MAPPPPELPLANAALTLPSALHFRTRAYRPLTLYLVAMLAVALAVLFTTLLWDFIKPNATPLFFGAVMVSAWVGGLGPGLLATALSALSMEYFFMSSFHSGHWYEQMTRVEVFVLVALLISALNAARRRAEEILGESQRFLESALNSLSARIVVIDGAGTILAVNGAWRRFGEAGAASGGNQGPGANYLEIWKAEADVKEEATLIETGIRDVLRGNRAELFSEYQRHVAGEPRWFAVRVTRFGGDGPVRAVVAHEDITEHKRVEEAERREEALRSVARLASAAAHEINNPLAIIMGNVEIIGTQISPEAGSRIRPTVVAIERIREIVSRMARITDLKLYEQSSSLPEMLDLRGSSATVGAPAPKA